MDLFPHADDAFAKLKAARPEAESISDLLDLALETLDFRRDEDVAAAILHSILCHSKLAEALDSKIETKTPTRTSRRVRNPDPQAGLRVYDSETGSHILVPMWLWLR